MQPIQHFILFFALLSSIFLQTRGNATDYDSLLAIKAQISAEQLEQLPSFMRTDIGKLKRMEILYLIRNKLWGEIPFSVGNLTRLTILGMDHNNLEGPLPTSLGNCLNLLEFYVQSNKLSGVLPVELFNLSFLIDNYGY